MGLIDRQQHMYAEACLTIVLIPRAILKIDDVGTFLS